MEILNQFGINPILLLAQVVNFFVLLLILKRFLYKPILKVLEERKVKIEESLKNAEAIEKKLQETEVEAEKILAKALNEGQKIIDESKQAAAQIVADSQRGAAEIINKAQIQAKEVSLAEKVKIQQEIREDLGDIVLLVFEKIMGRKITDRQQKEFIEKEIKNLS